MVILHELYDRWDEIQKRNREGPSAGSEQDRIAEELNILEALRLLNCKAIPGEDLSVDTLLRERHKQMEQASRKRKE